MLTYLMLATAVALCTTPTGYALGSWLTSGRTHDQEVAAERLAAGVRRFVIAHLPRSDAQQKVPAAVAELVRLLELADACERSGGQPVPTMHFTRRVLKAIADRPNARLTERIAA